ncbi:unnamed protein product [Phyllotreta striolata]|uniref:Chitin-binding type-2 domain-containing protein n=1 Tax=Phyllotreta striolata TaxID=444603 RepID=A0A9N9TTT4_PHYSR|nr:unnamed protein product [Phyllotreta striolata]
MAGILKAILFSCIFYYVAAKSLQRSSVTKCGSANFITPHNALCDRYYLCKDGELEVEKCPEGTLFCSSSLQCENKENVDCGKLRIPNEGSERSIKNRFLNDLIDIDYITGIFDIIDVVVVDSQITLIKSDIDF